MGKIYFRSMLCGRLFYPLALTCFIFVAFQFYLFLVIGNMRNDYVPSGNSSSSSKSDEVFRRRQVSNSKGGRGQGDDRQDIRPAPCIDHTKETLSAFKRAITTTCKDLILETSCKHQRGMLYPPHLKRTCPNSESAIGRSYGCYRDSSKRRLLPDHVTEFKDTNSPGHCVNHCLRLGFSYAGVEYSKECHCSLNIPTNISTLSLPQQVCDSKCPGNSSLTCGGYYALDIYHTGFNKFYNNATYVTATSDLSQSSKVKIMFMLTLTGRGLRQVLRLLKTIYRPHHYYLIHVDQRQEYLHRELERIVSSFPNIHMAKIRFSTIWGGASLLGMLLSCMEEAAAITDWQWDYFINLSESDYPIKTIEELDSFLTTNSGKNFLKSHGKNTARFIQRQGLDMLFLECENRMWRLGTRPLQSGINIDGGSDWIGLHRSFVTYLISGSDPLLNGLKSYWKYSLLPAESFFHTVLQNSRFCWSLVNNNLHLTNWRRKQGCHCQYKHVVDWCGCSPNDYRLSDFTKLQYKILPEYFARKFEAIINQDIVNLVDEHLLKRRTLGQPSADSFWLNIWNSEDSHPNDLLLSFFSSLTRSIHSRCSFGAPLRILDAHVFKRLEKIEGVVLTVKLVDSEVRGARSNLTNYGRGHANGVMEALFSSTNQNYDFLRKRKPMERISLVEVGTDFDPKEEIFRNYLSIFGPNADVVVSLHIVVDNEAEGTLSIQLIDPQANVAYTSSFTAPKGASIVTHTPRLEKPLHPGVWMVKTREPTTTDRGPNSSWIIQTKFLILPLSHHQGRLINEKEAALLNQGPFTSPNEIDEPSRLDVHKNSPPIGRDLDDWIDQLLASFWNQASSCLAQPLPEAGQTSLCRVLPPCSETYWSTLYPDPKSSFVPEEFMADGGLR